MAFYKKYITLNLNEYEAFGGTDLYISMFIGILMSILCIGIFVSSYRKNIMIKFVRQLYRHAATNETGAKNISELGMKNTALLRKLLSSGRLYRAVARAGEVRLTYDEYIESEKAKKQEKRKKRIADEAAFDKISQRDLFDSYKFYIPSECDMAAKGIISKPETSVLQCILLCVFVICISVCLIFLMPEILDLLNTSLLS